MKRVALFSDGPRALTMSWLECLARGRKLSMAFLHLSPMEHGKPRRGEGFTTRAVARSLISVTGTPIPEEAVSQAVRTTRLLARSQRTRVFGHRGHFRRLL